MNLDLSRSLAKKATSKKADDAEPQSTETRPAQDEARLEGMDTAPAATLARLTP